MSAVEETTQGKGVWVTVGYQLLLQGRFKVREVNSNRQHLTLIPDTHFYVFFSFLTSQQKKKIK